MYDKNVMIVIVNKANLYLNGISKKREIIL